MDALFLFCASAAEDCVFFRAWKISIALALDKVYSSAYLFKKRLKTVTVLLWLSKGDN